MMVQIVILNFLILKIPILSQSVYEKDSEYLNKYLPFLGINEYFCNDITYVCIDNFSQFSLSNICEAINIRHINDF